MVLGSCQVSDGLKSWPEDVTFHSRWTGSSADLMFPAQVIFSPGYFKNAWKSTFSIPLHRDKFGKSQRNSQ